VMFRAGVVVVLALGTTAFWLVPFLVMKDAFVLTPPSDVRASLDLLSGALGRRPGAFLTRAGPEAVTYDFGRLVEDFLAMKGNVAASFYLGWAAVVGTLVTVVLIARRNDDDDGTLCAVLIASVLGIWLSLGTVPLAGSNLTTVSGAGALVVVGTLSGLLIGAFLRRLQLGRRAVAWAVACALALFAAPYVSPIVAAQRFVPFLEYIRFPRFWPLAAMGVALGAAYPLVVLQRWAEGRQRRLAPLFGAATALAMCGILFADLAPYRGYYALTGPDHGEAHAEMLEALGSLPLGERVAVRSFTDPSLARTLTANGWQVSTGWPHAAASREVWQLTAAALDAPIGFRHAALGLLSTGWVVSEELGPLDEEPRRVTGVALDPNPYVRPMVRAYEQVVALEDGSIAPELAVAMARRNVSVVTGLPADADLRGLPVDRVEAADACGPPPAATETATGAPTGPPASPPADVAANVAVACSLHQWLGVSTNLRLVSIDGGAGMVLRAAVDGLRGVSVLFDRLPTTTELVLYELTEGGRALGAEVRVGRYSGYDENTLSSFLFDPVPGSAGQQYVFILRCPDCGPGEEPQVIEVPTEDGSGAVLVGGELRPGRVLASTPLYDLSPPRNRAATQIQSSRPRPGAWRIRVDAPRPALVVVAEAAFPGWRAKVDGRPADVLTADGALLGVAVPAGAHDITLTYQRPAASWVGRAITFATLGACAVVFGSAWAAQRRLRRRRVRPSGPSPGQHLDVGAEARQPAGQSLLQPVEKAPRAPAGPGQRPRRERDQAVLAPLDDIEAGLVEQVDEITGREARVDVDAVPPRPDPAADPDTWVVLDGLGEDEVTPWLEDASDLPQDAERVGQVVEHVDAPHQPEGPRAQGEVGAVGHRPPGRAPA
jgi:uncharacterized protein (DUF2249 family)